MINHPLGWFGYHGELVEYLDWAALLETMIRDVLMIINGKSFLVSLNKNKI